MSSWRITITTVWLMIFLILPGFLLTICSSATPPVIPTPKVVEPPPPVAPEAEVSVMIEVNSPDPVSYQWIPDERGGEILAGETTSAVTWQAPRQPGRYNILVKVTINGVVYERAVAISVEEKPAVVEKSTDTPTPKATNSPTPNPTPTLTPLPTDTPTPIPSNTPTLTPCLFAPPIREPIIGPPVEVQASITSIDHCADDLPIDTLFPVSGTYTGDLTDKELWILVYTPNKLYFPQAGDICANQATSFAYGQWKETIRLGGPESPAETYHIVAVVTNVGDPASQAFHNYLSRGCASHSYEGLTFIPPGATELDSIIVHTFAPTLTPPPPSPTPEGIIALNPADFERQGDQFIFFTTFERGLPLPFQNGVNLSDYDLEFIFRGADGQQVQLFYKSAPNWSNVVSSSFPLSSDQPIRFNPFVKDHEQSDPGFDFIHIWAIGARILGGIEGVELISARLIKR